MKLREWLILLFAIVALALNLWYVGVVGELRALLEDRRIGEHAISAQLDEYRKKLSAAQEAILAYQHEIAGLCKCRVTSPRPVERPMPAFSRDSKFSGVP